MVLPHRQQHTAEIHDLFAAPSAEDRLAERRGCEPSTARSAVEQAQDEVTAMLTSRPALARSVLVSVAREHGLETGQARTLARSGVARLRSAGVLATATGCGHQHSPVEAIMARIQPILAAELGWDPDHHRVVALAHAMATAASDHPQP